MVEEPNSTFILHGDFHQMHENRKGRGSNEAKELQLSKVQ